MTSSRLALALALALAAGNLAAAAEPLTTVAERSGFVRTGRYDEVIALCAQFAARYPDAVRCIDFGTTPEGRPMKALVATRTGALTAEAARARDLPVVLVQGGIHAGEIDGKDAGFLALRELLDGKAGRGVLDRLVLVFVPVFNIDGHERFGAWNRPNQRGPEEMGWRTTAQNLNLNRDYAKADAPEMRAMLALVNAWDPLATIDLHVTDGAKFQHDVAIQVEPVHAGDAALRVAGTQFRDAVVADLRNIL
jgi:murein tripeptide amidase MpaA